MINRYRHGVTQQEQQHHLWNNSLSFGAILGRIYLPSFTYCIMLEVGDFGLRHTLHEPVLKLGRVPTL